jgi:hypothetical protein
MHETKRRHSAERRAGAPGAAAFAKHALKLAHKGDLKTAARAALLAERLQRLESKMRVAKRSAAAQHASAAAAIAKAQRDLATLPSAETKPLPSPSSVSELMANLHDFPNIRRTLEHGD